MEGAFSAIHRWVHRWGLDVTKVFFILRCFTWFLSFFFVPDSELVVRLKIGSDRRSRSIELGQKYRV